MTAITELQKSQLLRLWDVFGLGPFMIWYAYKAKGMGTYPKYFMVALGGLTILYNGRNYLINRKLMAEGKIIPLNPLQETQL